MTRVTAEILGRETEATLKGTVWEHGEQYFVVETSGSEYRIEEDAIAEEIPPVPRLDTEGERRLEGTVQCPNCRYTRDFEGRYEGRLDCPECGETAGIDAWKAATPSHHFEYTVEE